MCRLDAELLFLGVDAAVQAEARDAVAAPSLHVAVEEILRGGAEAAPSLRTRSLPSGGVEAAPSLPTSSLPRPERRSDGEEEMRPHVYKIEER